MIRAWIGAGLLAILLAAGLLVGEGVERRFSPGAEELERAAAAALAGDWEKAEALTDTVRAKWEKNRSAAAGLAGHEELERIESAFAQLPIYAGEDGAAYSVICVTLARQLDSLAKTHQCGWENLL